MIMILVEDRKVKYITMMRSWCFVGRKKLKDGVVRDGNSLFVSKFCVCVCVCVRLLEIL
jgi:hypothetical protein